MRAEDAEEFKKPNHKHPNFDRVATSRLGFAGMRKPKAALNPEEMLSPREAALELRVSFPTIKQWIYAGKIRSVRTPGGHHRIPQKEVDRLLYRTRGHNAAERQDVIRNVSGRNQLVGRIEEVRISGLMAEVRLSIGNQIITSIITARSAREMNLKPGQAAAALIKATEVMILRV
jgi:molybdopterin-binding protein